MKGLLCLIFYFGHLISNRNILNFLSHIFLSNDFPDVQVGNFIADSYKGKSYEILPNAISKGVQLHRAIDDYFDKHYLVKKQYNLLKPHYGRYSGVGVDLINDHLLAKYFDDYSCLSLTEFSQRFYQYLKTVVPDLEGHSKLLSEKIIEGDWLSQYPTSEGMQKIAVQLENRIGREIGFKSLNKIIITHEPTFERDFRVLFKDMQLFSKTKFHELF